MRGQIPAEFERTHRRFSLKDACCSGRVGEQFSA
jgi:hypothetical protein